LATPAVVGMLEIGHFLVVIAPCAGWALLTNDWNMCVWSNI